MTLDKLAHKTEQQASVTAAVVLSSMSCPVLKPAAECQTLTAHHWQLSVVTARLDTGLVPCQVLLACWI